ncbi:MAG: HEAT repeat domain-containing protein [Holophagales bacterium]|nr:HEAT repeat domain-containing protein [Holophagales bacterium]
MGSAALIFQVLFTARIHRRLGIGVALKVPPVSNGLGAAAFLLAAMLAPAFLWPVVWLLKLSENGLRYSLEQVTRELLFVPVPEHARPRAKVIVDVVVQRAAKGLAAAVLLSVTFGWLSVPQTAWIALVSVALWLWVLREIQERYVDSFRQGLLRRHRSSAGGEQLDLRDGATLEVLIGGLGSLDAKEVCHSLDLLAAHGRGHLVPPALLTHPESQVRLRTLEILRQVGHGRATPWVERLLADPDPPVRAAAFRALASLVPESLVMEMEERLYDSDPRVRAVAAAYLAANADPGPKEKADASLEAMIEDADGSVREEAARALGELDDPRFQAALVRLLYDPNPDVVRAAIGAVAERTSRGRASPLYVPILVSHLHRRNLKHEARDTLVAYGEGVIPALQHFLFDVNEQIWVRRALPRTIARIGGPAARLALTDALGARDPFQRRKVIEALQDLRSDSAGDAPGGNVAGVVEQLSAGGAAPGGWSELDARVVENVIAAESRQCLELLLDLWGLEAYAAADDDGGGGISAASTARDSLPWISPRAGGAMGREVSGRGAPLLTRLLADRLLSHRANVFGLLSLLHSEREMAAARRGLESGRPELRAHALEYLDNVLQGEVRQQVFAVIDELPRADRLREARRLFGLVPETAETVLRRLALERPPGDYDAPWLTAAALRLIYDARIEALYPLLRRSAERDPEPLVQETAAHLIAQLKAEGLLPGP